MPLVLIFLILLGFVNFVLLCVPLVAKFSSRTSVYRALKILTFVTLTLGYIVGWIYLVSELDGFLPVPLCAFVIALFVFVVPISLVIIRFVLKCVRAAFDYIFHGTQVHCRSY